MPAKGGTAVLILCLSIIDWLNTEEGQDLAEYGLLLGLIAVVVVVVGVVVAAGRPGEGAQGQGEQWQADVGKAHGRSSFGTDGSGYDLVH